MSKPIRFPEEFKIEAIKQVIDRGYRLPSLFINRMLELGWEKLRKMLLGMGLPAVLKV